MSNEAKQLHQLFKSFYRHPKYSSETTLNLSNVYIKKLGFSDKIILELQNKNIIEQTDGNTGYKLTDEAIKDYMSIK